MKGKMFFFHSVVQTDDKIALEGNNGRELPAISPILIVTTGNLLIR